MNNQDLELLKNLGKAYQDCLELLDDEDFVIDKEQYKVLEKMCSLLSKVVDNCGGHIEKINLRPREQHAYITAYLNVFDVYGEQLKEFATLLSNASAFGLDVGYDKVCVSITIPRVFVHK